MSKVCVWTSVQAETHQKTGQLPDCWDNHHRHVSHLVAEKIVKAHQADWVGDIAIVMRLKDSQRLVICRSGTYGPVVVQLIRC